MMKFSFYRQLEKLEQKISNYCENQSLPRWYTIEELLELNQSKNSHINLTYNQKEKLYQFKKELEKYY